MIIKEIINKTQILVIAREKLLKNRRKVRKLHKIQPRRSWRWNLRNI